MRKHSGEHPAMGSLDVLPFVPLEGATIDDAVRLARRAGERIGDLGLFVYLYEAAASAPHRRNLADIRRGGYEGLASRTRDPLWKPDYGPPQLAPEMGAVGARPFLVAFNAYLDTGDVEVARSVARKVRERDGGLPGVKALGLLVGDRAQVSMNLTELGTTPLPAALEAVRAAATEDGVGVERTELVGLAPLEALLQTARHCLRLDALGEEHVLEAELEGRGSVIEEHTERLEATPEALPDFPLNPVGELGGWFVMRGMLGYRDAAGYIRGLPYGRNSRRSDHRLVLEEGQGTCSTKHALLAELAEGRVPPVELRLGVYEMDGQNTPGVGPVLRRHGLVCIPEAHCYLAYRGIRVDLTRSGSVGQSLRLLHEERISPHQVGAYKVQQHRGFVREWAAARGLGFERAWRAREDCIRALAGAGGGG